MSTSEDIPKSSSRLPTWVQFLLAIIVSLATGAVGYGELKERVRAVEARLERDEHQGDDHVHDGVEREKDTRKAIEDVRNALGTLQLDVARICARVKC